MGPLGAAPDARTCQLPPAMWFDIEPPEYDWEPPVSSSEDGLGTTPQPKPLRAKATLPRVPVLALYPDTPLVLASLNGTPGFVDTSGRFWPGLCAQPDPTERPELLLLRDAVGVCTIPAGVAASRTPTTASFYDFSVADWFVVLCDSATAAAAAADAPTVMSIGTVLPPEGKLCEDAVTAMDAQPVSAPLQCMYVHAADCARAAHWLLLRHALRVFPGMAVTDVHTPVTRAECAQLDAPRQNALEEELARCADAVTSGRVAAHADSLTGLYDPARVDVSRAALKWGMFAVMQMRSCLLDATVPVGADALFEPLASYAAAVMSIQAARARAEVPVLTLQFSSEQKPSAAQQEHAMALFYWAAIHADPSTAALGRADALLNLELYTRYGLLVVRRRAYHFRNGNKKRRKRKSVTEDV